ncbi:MAG TPA: SDR family NAD(P)-dependent oxidoreductase [Chloroflexota bacterium]|nr:SDR family NAD(P)-dependent oxidoreductase [Chloroflexota bacterium]
MIDFSGDVVLVTGAASGIGLEIARAFYDVGARVALGDLRWEALGRAMAHFDDAERVHLGEVDVRDAASVGAFVASAESVVGGISIAIACAGIYPNTPVLDLSVEDWDRVMETNVRGVFLTCQAVARRMISQRIPGKIITIASTAYQVGRVGAAHYCASKAAVAMFTKVLALELAPHGINANAIAPGMIEVGGGMSAFSPEYFDAMTKAIPKGRAGKSGDVANAALFLASPFAEFITGDVLLVDGGYSIGRASLPPSTPPASR